MPTDPPPDKPPLWADILLTLWVVAVGVLFYGPLFWPSLGAFVGVGAAFYGLLLLASAAVLALRFLGRGAR